MTKKEQGNGSQTLVDIYLNHQEFWLKFLIPYSVGGSRNLHFYKFPGGAAAALEDALRTSGVKGEMAAARKACLCGWVERCTKKDWN